MKTVSKVYESDESGTVHVDVPVGAAHRRVQVEVTWMDAAEEQDPIARKRAELEALAGALSDDSFERPAQPMIETRPALE